MWMSNSLELFHFLSRHVHELVMDTGGAERGANASSAGAEEEVMATLEDVVMYTFQQTVYYLTKVDSFFFSSFSYFTSFREQEKGSVNSL